MEKKTKTRILWILSLIVLVPGGLIAIAGAYLTIAPRLEVRAHRLRFDSSGWLARSRDQTSEWPTRLRMADDLVRSKRLDGLQRAEVTALLGPGDQTDMWRNWDLAYWLGPERGFIRIDSEWLVLRFDMAGRVVEYRVVHD